MTLPVKQDINPNFDFDYDFVMEVIILNQGCFKEVVGSIFSVLRFIFSIIKQEEFNCFLKFFRF